MPLIITYDVFELEQLTWLKVIPKYNKNNIAIHKMYGVVVDPLLRKFSFRKKTNVKESERVG